MRVALPIILLILLVGAGAYLLSGSQGAAASKEFALRIAERKVVEGPTVLTVRKSDTVTIRIATDEAEEFHLHGYDRSVDLVPGALATLTFVADTAGRFPAELEHSKTEIVTLEVLP